MKIENDFGPFHDLANSNSPVDPMMLDAHMAEFASRVKMLHWALQTLAVAEFRTQDDNEWLWQLSKIVWEVIERDAQQAAKITTRYCDALRETRTKEVA